MRLTPLFSHIRRIGTAALCCTSIIFAPAPVAGFPVCNTVCAGSNGYGEPLCTKTCTDYSRPSGPAAPAESPPAVWGAMALAEGASGFSYNHTSSAAAERGALAACNKQLGRTRGCKVVELFANSCGGLAVAKGIYGKAVARSERAARADALGACRLHEKSDPCKVVIAFCSPLR